MTLENIQVDFTSRSEIPTKDAIHVLVDAVANMSISTDPKRQAIAASKFAGYTIKQIQDIVIPVLEGNIREIISQTNFEDLIRGDKKAFSELVMENVTPNLADLGIDLTTFNIQNFSDKNGVIHDLGIENIEKIKKEASIAAARSKGLAEAEAIKAKAEAEAKGMLEKAEAMKQFQSAAVMDMQLQAVKTYFEQLPAIAKAIGEGYQGVDKIVMLGNESGQLAGNIMNTTTQISEGLAQSLGVDLKGLLSGFLGGKIAIGSETEKND